MSQSFRNLDRLGRGVLRIGRHRNCRIDYSIFLTDLRFQALKSQIRKVCFDTVGQPASPQQLRLPQRLHLSASERESYWTFRQVSGGARSEHALARPRLD
jgi:hypothetical protein